MTTERTLVSDFNTANRLYAGATVTLYGVSAGAKDTGNIVPCYAAKTGTEQVSNPQTLDAEGKWVDPPYVDESVIMSITGPHVGDHDSGIIAPRLDETEVDSALASAMTTGSQAAMAVFASQRAKKSAQSIDLQQIALMAQSFG